MPMVSTFFRAARLASAVAVALIALACGRDEPQFRPARHDGERAGTDVPAADGPPRRAGEPTGGRSASSAAPNPGDIPAPPDVAAPPADAQRTASGLASRVLRPGSGTRHPAPTSRVEVHYTGWTTDGRMFDSSVARGEPATFPLDRVIPGWTEGLQLMVEGEARRFWIPPNLAYEGRRGPQGMLVFDVELIRILE